VLCRHFLDVVGKCHFFSKCHDLPDFAYDDGKKTESDVVGLFIEVGLEPPLEREIVNSALHDVPLRQDNRVAKSIQGEASQIFWSLCHRAMMSAATNLYENGFGK
jgi:hypothetical protein